MFRLILLLLFLITGKVFSQTITGTVLDAKKMTPLPDCIVILKGHTVTSVTTEKGNFTISLPQGLNDPILVFSQIGYHTAVFKIKSLRDTFYLTAKDIQLKEIEIVAQKKTILNAESTESLLDFDFLNEHIIQLVAGADGNALKLMNDRGALIAKIKVNKNSSYLKKDCLGNLQLISEDSTWQVFYDFEKLNILNPYTLQNYQFLLGNCVCVNKENYYFREMEYRNLRCNYYYFSEKDKGVRNSLAGFSDSAKIRRFEMDYNLQYFLNERRKSNYTVYNESVDVIKKKIRQYREELPLDWGYISWLGSVETEMVRNDSALYIVNFTDTLIYSIQANTIKPLCRLYAAIGKKHLLSHVYTDIFSNENYLVQFTNSNLIVTRFNIESGKELSRTEIPGVPYMPKKIVFSGGSAFFIRKNLADDQPYQLTRYKLD
ncbi:MAG: carboxypeptidase-like regulatory domain-containing protein [Bacteroidota bacterium]|nr:carboxypeptidase-like regulatory domain-containing protein [Bacteroidota bacterium]